MRVLFCALLLVSAAALAEPDGGQDRDVAAMKEKLQAMLDEAALLEQAGRADDAAKVRAEAAELKRKVEGAREGKDDPRMQALQNLEKAIGALDKAGYEGMAKDLRGMADRLRADIKGARGQERPDADFWRRNIDTLRIARKGLGEAGRADAADAMGRVISAREMLLSGRTDEEARQVMRKSPGDGDIAELLLKAAGCWREFKQPEQAASCEELGRFFQQRVEKMRAEKVTDFAREQKGPGPEDRIARLEARLDRMEAMLAEALRRMEQREQGRER